jgi:hypothetical protein
LVFIEWIVLKFCLSKQAQVWHLSIYFLF